MAVLHKKEEKIQAVLGRLSKKYTHEEFVAMFIKLYSKDWGKIKSAYIKQSQDKEPGTVINMPKPDLYLKQVLDTYLANNTSVVTAKEEAIVEVKEVKEKATAKKKIVKAETVIELNEEVATKEVKAKAPSKKKVIKEETIAELETDKKVKAPAKKKVVATEVEPKPKAAKIKTAKAEKK